MAGLDRPKCPQCGKWYRFQWSTETMIKGCKCEEKKLKKEIDNQEES